MVVSRGGALALRSSATSAGKWFVRFLVVLPWAAPVALVDDRLALDLRLAVQHRQLDAEGDPHCSAPSASLFGIGNGCGPNNPPQWLGNAEARDVRDHHRPGLADPPVRGDHLHRRPGVDPDRGRRRREDRLCASAAEEALVRRPARSSCRSRSSRCSSGSSSPPPTSPSSSSSPTAALSTRRRCLTTWAYTIGIESGSLGAGAAISLFLFPLLVGGDDPDALLRHGGRRCRS